MARTATLQDPPIDTKLKLSALWITTLFVFAYVDIFQHFRPDFLEHALEGKVVGTPFVVSQTFLTLTLLYIVVPSSMVIGSLVMRARINRITNISVAAIYALTVIVSTIGEQWIYYLIGSAIEVALLVAIGITARNWPQRTSTPHNDAILYDETSLR